MGPTRRGIHSGSRGCLGADDRGGGFLLPHSCRQTPRSRRPQLTSLSDRVPSVPAVPAPFAHQAYAYRAFTCTSFWPQVVSPRTAARPSALLMGTCSARSPTHGLPGLLLTLRCQPHLSGHPGFMLTLGVPAPCRAPCRPPGLCASGPGHQRCAATPRSLSKHRTNALDLLAFPSTAAVPGRQARSSLCQRSLTPVWGEPRRPAV